MLAMFSNVANVGWAFLTSKLGGPLFALVSVGLGVTLVAAKMDAAGANRRADQLSAAIHTPVTGWAARLERCNANAKGLLAAVEEQNAAMNAYRAQVAQQQRAASSALDAAQAGRAKAQATAAKLLGRARSADVCQDVMAADAALLEVLP